MVEWLCYDEWSVAGHGRGLGQSAVTNSSSTSSGGGTDCDDTGGESCVHGGHWRRTGAGEGGGWRCWIPHTAARCWCCVVVVALAVVDWSAQCPHTNSLFTPRTSFSLDSQKEIT